MTTFEKFGIFFFVMIFVLFTMMIIGQQKVWDEKDIQCKNAKGHWVDLYKSDICVSDDGRLLGIVK